MMGKADYYTILGVSRDADAEELKRAYRQQALKHHPDRNPGDKEAEEKFKASAEAYEILRDPNKRQLYDQYGHAGLQDTQFGGFRDFNDIFSNFGDIFGDFFGFGRRGRAESRARQGEDLHYQLDISFTDAIFGKETTIEILKSEACGTCRGSGVKPGSKKRTCTFCQGQGTVSHIEGFFRINRTCPQCYGQGSVITDPCPGCRGTGQQKHKKQVNLKIPPGVDNDTRMRLRGEGEAGQHGGPAGDLFIDLRVESHPLFRREGTNLHYRTALSFVEATLGTEIEIPTLTGATKLQIPPGTQPGAVFRLYGEGAPSLRGNGRGHIVVELDMKTPTALTPAQEELLRQFLQAADRPASSSSKKKKSKLHQAKPIH
jgi:molecular chaperone DnaJ